MFLYYKQILGTGVFKPDVCFKKFDLLELQAVHNVLYDSFLFTNATTLIFVLSAFFLKTKQ